MGATLNGKRLKLCFLGIVISFAVSVGMGSTVFATPYFLIDSQAEWQDALTNQRVKAMTLAEWTNYMALWSQYHEGPNYPANIFKPPQLYVWGGGGEGLYPPDPGLVMAWGSLPQQPPGSYCSAWKYDYQQDPDLSNCTITLTVTAPQFDELGNQVNVVSFGIKDTNGKVRAWYWNCGPSQPIPWNTPTTITINTALTGTAAATPVATSYMNTPGFSLQIAQYFIVDENAQWVGGTTPVPPPGQPLPRMWNYWHDIMVTPNIQKQALITKWSQPPVEEQPGKNPPIFYGWDEKSDPYFRPIMADDWVCKDDRPVTDIHFWGSFLGWDQPVPPPEQQISAFVVGIWTDIPQGVNNPYSHPGQLIWQKTYSTYQWNFAGYDKDPRGLYQNEACFQYNIYLDPADYFYQAPGPVQGTVYWLSIYPLFTQPTGQYRWGWKTRAHTNWPPPYHNDDAVRIYDVTGPWPPSPTSSIWLEGTPVEYPTGTSWDLAFELSTDAKWYQPPDLTPNGMDVKATYPLILADDWQCTKQTKVTDITVWGSWLNDHLPLGALGPDPSNVTFTLSIHDDIPGNGTVWSRPGVERWQKTFTPGQFTVSQEAIGLTEGWYDPSDPSSYNPYGDTICWKYDFTIPEAEAFCQEGTPSNPKVYWLDVQVKVPAAPSGCILPDNGTGTVDLPPAGCSYLTPNDDMKIIDGLPAGSTVDIDAVHTNFVCQGANNICSFLPGSNCRQSGGTLGGEKECFSSQLILPMVGTGAFNGFSRNLVLPTDFEVHTAPRIPGNPVQSFNTDMFRMFGQIIGDPDFDLLRISAGTDFGLPSPGHTTLTQQAGGNWAVDSFFDITYRIDFVGASGGPFGGMSGSTTGTIRFQTPGGAASSAQFGWKTSTQHWNDDAVWGQGIEPYTGPWIEMRYPQNHQLAGQSIDLAFRIDGNEPCTQGYDWGDAPDGITNPTYPTYWANMGASHLIVPGFHLGALIDAEADGQPTPLADGDDTTGLDDEDGVMFTTPLVPGAPATAIVTASAAGKLDAWIDFNADGDWADSGEHIAAGTPLAMGPNSITFTVPNTAGTVGFYKPTFSRFRFSSTGGLPYIGPAADGEVEDYRVQISPRPVVVTKARAKCLALGTYVMIEKNVVTANFGSYGWYFEEPDRSMALGVLPPPNGPPSTWSPGDLVSCYGFTVLNGCELMLQELYSLPEGSGSVLPLGQNNRASGGGPFCNQPGLINRIMGPFTTPATGLNTVGMLVTLWGRCTGIETNGVVQTNFWIDDGSYLIGGNFPGVKVRIPTSGAPSIQVNSFYVVTGIMRTDTFSGNCVRWLWPRNSADIR